MSLLRYVVDLATLSLSVCTYSYGYSDSCLVCNEFGSTVYDGLGVMMTSQPLDLSSIFCNKESTDFTLVGIYNALTVSSLDVGSTPKCEDMLLSV